MTSTQLKTLRSGKPLNLFNRSQKQFVKIQLNHKFKRIAWERYISLDKQNWIKQNAYLSLRDVKAVLQYYINLNPIK